LLDIENYLRSEYKDARYVAYGQKILDSLERRAYIKTLANDCYIDKKSFRLFPIATFSQKDVIKYIDLYRTPKPLKLCDGKSKLTGISLENKFLTYIKHSYPEDYRKIINQFPFAESLIHD
jgi:sulfate adenylyltransferase subunit 2